jgi:uncharacterized protein (DUF2062 family)
MIKKKMQKKHSIFNLKAQAKEIFHTVVNLDDTPENIALGFAIGTFVGLLPIMGIQMTVVFLLVLPFKRVNKPSAVAAVWISNPLTVIPIYFFIYWIGSFFYGTSQKLSFTVWADKFNNILKMNGFVEQTKGFLALGSDIFIPMFIGGTIIGLLSMFPAYFLMKKAVKAYRYEKKHLFENESNN